MTRAALSPCRALAVVAVVAALLAGCGDGGEDPDRTADAPATTATAPPTTAPPTTAPAEEREPLESPAAREMREPATAPAPTPSPTTGSASDPAFLRAAFTSSKELWRRQFRAAGAPFRDPHLVFFHTTVDTPCGRQSAQTGPFYCPAGYGVFLNTDFFAALAREYGLRSGFAGGFVVAHELGHHVQQLLGLHARVAQADAADPAGANRRSIAVELQADCYAGVWLHDVAAALTDEDLRHILGAAAVVGDDFRRNRAGKELAPETWTHGSSAQRVRWLRTGKASGVPAACDTFTREAGGG